jgi:hypothetical protein
MDIRPLSGANSLLSWQEGLRCTLLCTESNMKALLMKQHVRGENVSEFSSFDDGTPKGEYLKARS